MKLAAVFLPHHYHHKKSPIINEIGFGIYAFLFLCIGLGLITIQHAKPSVLSYASNISETDIITDTNIERQKLGIGQLSDNAELTQAAQAKASNMFVEDYWAHFGPHGETPWQFITQSGYQYVAAGENLARDFNDSNSVVQAWMNSPSHRENLLNKNYQDIGVAVVNGTLLGRETTLVVQMFGKSYQAKSQLVQSASAAVTNSQAGITTPTPTSVAVAVVTTTSPTPLPIASMTTRAAVSGVQNVPDNPQPSTAIAGIHGINAFLLIRSIGIGFLALAVVFLAIDTIAIRKRGVVRIATHSVPHIAILTVIAIGIVLLQSGKIL